MVVFARYAFANRCSESEDSSLASDLFDHLMIIAQLFDQCDSENDDDDCEGYC